MLNAAATVPHNPGPLRRYLAQREAKLLRQGYADTKCAMPTCDNHALLSPQIVSLTNGVWVCETCIYAPLVNDDE